MISVKLPQYDRVLRIQKGENLLELFQKTGFYLPSDCAGAGTCGKCIVKLKDYESPIQDIERKYLSEQQLRQGIRMSCCIFPDKDCSVEFISVAESESDQILTEGVRQHIIIDSIIQKSVIQVEQPSLTTDLFDYESLLKPFENPVSVRKVSISFLEKLPRILRQNDYEITLIYNDSHFIDIEPGKSAAGTFGLAVDLGTTTIVVKLIDLLSGVVQGVAAGVNPQHRFGADVISRIGYTQKRSDGSRRLHRILVDKLNEMISSLIISEGISPDQVYDVTVAGNTVMGHLFLGLDTTNMALLPYTPVVQYYPEILAADIGLAIHPGAGIQLLPNIGRFVGGDTTGVILSTGLDQSQSLTLAIDIGTNGEIVLGNRDKILATSTAAGPAFEGARIQFGMRATEGAIDRAEIKNGDLHLHTIANRTPKGICGSGIICLIGELLRSGIISWTGQLLSAEESNLNSEITNRIMIEGKEKVFLLHSSKGRAVFLTQRDVREIQLAKSAIRTGINLLIKEFGISADDIDRILLAGAFGNFLDREQTIRIGLLPDVPLEKIRYIGNAACAGAELALLSREKRKRTIDIAKNTQYFEIATHPDFHDQYAENMLFDSGKK